MYYISYKFSLIVCNSLYIYDKWKFAWECVEVESCFQEFAKKVDASFALTPHIFIFEASFLVLFYNRAFL